MSIGRMIGVCLGTVTLPLMMVGCGGGPDVGPTGEVEGKVLVDGQPLTEGSVSLYDKTTGNTGGGEVGADGTFKFTVPVPVGKYQVAVLPPDAPAPDDPQADMAANQNAMIHDLYRSGETSEIVADVKEGPNSFTFELKKSGPRS